MNKFFEFKDYLERQNNRPYYRSTWEPIQMEGFRLLPFQIPANASDYTMYHVSGGVETDITSSMNGVAISSDYMIYDGSVLDVMINDGRCYFKIVHGTEEYYSEDCEIGNVNTLVSFWDGDSNYYDKSFVISYEEILTSNIFKVNKGEIVTVYVYNDKDESGFIAEIAMDSDTAMSGSQVGDISVFSATAEQSGDAYIKLTSDAIGNTNIYNYEVTRGYSDQFIKLKVSSTVDYGTVKYVTGWTQHVFKKSNVRRSPINEITQIGEERNGVIIIEKHISALRYKVIMKVTEQEYEALVHAVAGTLTIYDQTGRVYNAVNVELNEPNWYQGNGVCELSFVDSNNISVHTLNNTAL